MTIQKNTLLAFTEVKRGHATPKNYELTAEKFISIVKNKDHDGSLDVGITETADGEFTPDLFWELPIEEQLNRCCNNEGDRYASTIRYEVAA